VAGQRKLGTVRETKTSTTERKRSSITILDEEIRKRNSSEQELTAPTKIADLPCSLMVGKGTLQTWPASELVLCNRGSIKHQMDVDEEEKWERRRRRKKQKKKRKKIQVFFNTTQQRWNFVFLNLVSIY
jgi:hypothetical protein